MNKQIEIKTLLEHIVKECQDNNITLTKEKLINLAYLCELEYYREHRQRLTKEDWYC